MFTLDAEQKMWASFAGIRRHGMKQNCRNTTDSTLNGYNHVLVAPMHKRL